MPTRVQAGFDQGEFEFSAAGGDAGYRNWQAELDAQKRAFERRWGIAVGRRVRVQLANCDDELEGVIRISQPPPGAGGQAKPPVLSIGQFAFYPQDVERIVRLDDGL